MITWKAAKTVENGVVYPMDDGTVWFFDGKTVEQVTPFKVSLPNPE